MMMGAVNPSARSVLQTSSPESFGIMMSRITRSGFAVRARSSPLAPSAAVSTS